LFPASPRRKRSMKRSRLPASRDEDVRSNRDVGTRALTFGRNG
jgi:hypothetical protein